MLQALLMRCCRWCAPGNPNWSTTITPSRTGKRIMQVLNRMAHGERLMVNSGYYNCCDEAESSFAAMYRGNRQPVGAEWRPRDAPPLGMLNLGRAHFVGAS